MTFSGKPAIVAAILFALFLIAGFINPAVFAYVFGFLYEASRNG